MGEVTLKFVLTGENKSATGDCVLQKETLNTSAFSHSEKVKTERTEEKKVLKLLLMGKKGHGKSATGNSLLNRKVFQTSARNVPVTSELQCDSVDVERYLLMVVDGLCLDEIGMDTFDVSTSAERKIKKALATCNESVDAFLFVIKFGKEFTVEDRLTLEALKRVLGPSYLDHVIVVITGGDLFHATLEDEECEADFDGWCGQQIGELRQLYKDCKGRFVLFNNREKDEEKKLTQTLKIAQITVDLCNRYGPYARQLVEDSKSVLQQLTSEPKTSLNVLDHQEQVIPPASLRKTSKMGDKLNFLLMGKTGHGKSATGNLLLNRQAFKPGSNTTSETREVDFNFTHFENFTLLIVDGPGLDDTEVTKAEDRTTAAKNMDKALAICYGGVDAFLFVLKFGNRLTGEDKSTLEDLKKTFGFTYLNHVIVIVTYGDLFQGAMKEEGRNVSFKEWCAQQKGDFRELYDTCQGRFVLFNNRETDEEKKMAQIQEIVDLTLGLRERHDRYTSKCFQEAEKERERMILEKNAPHLKLEIQEKVALLSADLEKLSSKPSDTDRDRIISSIKNLKQEIEDKDNGHGVINKLLKLVKIIEENLHDIDELHNLATELEKARQTKEDWMGFGIGCGVIGFAAAAGVAYLKAAPVDAELAVANAGTLVAGVSGLALGLKEDKIKEQQTALENKLQNKRDKLLRKITKNDTDS